MRSWSWFAYKKRDATYCPHCRGLVLPGAAPGTFDFPKVGVTLWDKREVVFIDVEVKAASTSFPFKDFSASQRNWLRDNPDNPKFLWLCMGNSIRSKTRPRKTWMMPLIMFLQWEQELKVEGRLSLPYNHLGLNEYELEWAGKRTWTVPASHPLRTEYHYL